MGFGNKASVVNTEVNSVRSSSDFVSSDNVNMELSHIEHTTSEESLNLSASNAKSLENDSIGDNKLTESFSESNAEMLDEIYDPEDEQVEEEQTVEEEPTVEKQAEEEQEDEIFERVEKAPTFPGGQGAMMEFLSKNIKYPADCQRSGIQGRVIVSFVVNKDGTIQNVEVIRSVHKSLDAEAVRVVKSMPAWSPGEQQGSKVRSKFQLPVFFRLANK
ncbi:MAG: energy transducer TonB [Bacteroidales bacterium]|nr:energy transducer TonB [Candidatus Scybalocola fimicaballi]